MLKDMFILLFGWLPSWFTVIFFIILAVFAFILIFKIVSFVLDVIPFL